MKSFFKKFGKIAAVAVGAAAVAFTAGSALSSASGGTGNFFSQGWSGVSRSIGDMFGQGTALSNVVGGAVKYAGYGSLVGGAVNAVRGKSITDGLTKGALAGGAAGGLLGGLNMAGLPQGQSEADLLGNNTGDVSGGSASGNIAGGSGEDMLASASKAPQIAGGGGSDVVNSASASGFSGSGSQGNGNGLLSWLNQNPTVAGMAVQGVGQGLSGYAASGAEEDAARANAESAMERQRQQQQYIAGNYGTGEINPGMLAAPVAEGTPSPEQRFDPSTYGGRYVFDRATGRAVFVPNATA